MHWLVQTCPKSCTHQIKINHEHLKSEQTASTVYARVFFKFSNHGASPVGDFHLCANTLRCWYVPPTPQESCVESATLRVGLSPYEVTQLAL